VGLDITVVRHTQFIHSFESDEHDEDECEEKGYWSIYSLDDFVERLDGRPQGCYIVSDGEDDTLWFAAGSYSGYNLWREALSLVALDVPPEVVWNNRSAYKGKLCYELIDMADNEGAIGPATSRKLVADFDKLKPTVAAKISNLAECHKFGWPVQHWLRKFDEWHKAFKLVGSTADGFVIFH